MRYLLKLLLTSPGVLSCARARSTSVHASSSSVHNLLNIPRDKWSPGKHTFFFKMIIMIKLLQHRSMDEPGQAEYLGAAIQGHC